MWEALHLAATMDPFLIRIGLQADAAPGKPYDHRNSLLCYNNRIIIPPGSPQITALLKEHDDLHIGGHSGALRTFKRLAQQLFWPSMHKSVREYIAAYDTYQRVKYESLSPAGLLQPLPIPTQIWEDV